MSQRRQRLLASENNKSAAVETRQGWRRWSRLRRTLAAVYASALIAAVAGITYFTLSGPQQASASRDAPVKAVVVVPAAPFAAVASEENPVPVKTEISPGPRKIAARVGDHKNMRVVIVIDDMGPDVSESKRAIRLNRNVTLSFLPYARDVRMLARKAHAAGHELLLHLPMQPISRRENPGPEALLTSLSQSELNKRLDWNLSRFDGYVGVNNHMGSQFTANAADMLPVMEELKARGLLFLDSRTTDATVGRRVAIQVGVPFAERDVFLDNEVDFSAVEVQLEKVVKIARKYGLAIAIGHPHQVTLEKLAAWIPSLKKQGIKLVPLSRVVTRPVTMVKAESGTL